MIRILQRRNDEVKICCLTHLEESPEVHSCVTEKMFSRSQVYIQVDEAEKIIHTLFFFSYWLLQNQVLQTERMLFITESECIITSISPFIKYIPVQRPPSVNIRPQSADFSSVHQQSEVQADGFSEQSSFHSVWMCFYM